jgi:hypothetical protein
MSRRKNKLNVTASTAMIYMVINKKNCYWELNTSWLRYKQVRYELRYSFLPRKGAFKNMWSSCSQRNNSEFTFNILVRKSEEGPMQHWKTVVELEGNNRPGPFLVMKIKSNSNCPLPITCFITALSHGRYLLYSLHSVPYSWDCYYFPQSLFLITYKYVIERKTLHSPYAYWTRQKNIWA